MLVTDDTVYIIDAQTRMICSHILEEDILRGFLKHAYGHIAIPWE